MVVKTVKRCTVLTPGKMNAELAMQASVQMVLVKEAV